MKLKPILIFILFAFIGKTACFATALKQDARINAAITDTILSAILKQLHLTEKDVIKDLCISKIHPQDAALSIWVIPGVSKDEDGAYDDELFELNAYVLLIEKSTGKIVSKFFEPKAWLSEGVFRLSDIAIDTAPYILNSVNRGFGIRVSYQGASRPNPSGSTDFSLFIQDGTVLNRVMNSYPISEFLGEWDTNCNGEFESTQSVLIVDKKLSNGFYNIMVKQTTAKTQNYLVGGDCKEQVLKKRTKIITLRHNGKEYK